MNNFALISDALKELRKNNFLIVVDDPNRENQGDLIFPAQTAAPEKINFMLQKCRGLICVPITQSKATMLDLSLMIPSNKNTEKTKVNFTISLDAKNVKSYGISASDRSLTIRAIAHEGSDAADFVRPGHIFPLLAKQGGILERPGHTEASLELMRLAGFSPTAVLCEILNDEGDVANQSELIKFSHIYKIKIISIPDLIAYVKNN